MALTDGECNQCRLELGQLKARYEGAGAVPDVAKARLGELESALERECSPGSSSSAAGAAVVALGFGLLGIGLLAAWVGSSR
ncbi:hypothetical protein ES703_29872 [subsurface metagenome]